MKKTIYKYPLQVNDMQCISLPQGAEILTIQAQNDIPCLWALVDPEQMISQERHIEIFGTSHNIPCMQREQRIYISTFQLRGGSLVFHAFELIALLPH